MREKEEKPAKRKLTRAERKQIEAVIRQAKGDGKNHTVQDSIPFQNMFPDGLCRLEGGTFSKTIAFEDVNYRLAGPEDQRSIFESLCDFYNGYDPTIGVQVTLDSRSGGSAADEMFGIRRQGNDLDPIRDEAVDILRMQYKRGNNGYVKTKYVTLTIEAENLPAARARFARIETDTLNRFKVMGAAAHVLDGKERLELLYNILHPEGGQFAFEWDWLPASGLSVKDFISPSSFHFGETRTFRIGRRYGAVSFLQILAPEMHDRILTDFMEADGNIMVTMHIRGINQNEAIKMVKRKIPGYGFRMLVGDIHHLIVLYYSLARRLSEAETEKDFLRLKKKAGGYEKVLKKLFRSLGLPEDSNAAQDVLEESIIRRHNLVRLEDVEEPQDEGDLEGDEVWSD